MTAKLPPERAAVLRMIGFALLAGSLLVIGAGFWAGRTLEMEKVPVLAWVAAAWAVGSAALAPVIGNMLEQQARTAQALFTARLVPLAVLESGAVLCGVALMVSGEEFPALAAAAPLALLVQRIVTLTHD